MQFNEVKSNFKLFEEVIQRKKFKPGIMWITRRAAKLPPVVITAEPAVCWPNWLHSSWICWPPSLKMALLNSPALFMFISELIRFTMVFDSKTSAKLEMANVKSETSLRVSLRADEFDINLKLRTGKGRRNGETITIHRKVKGTQEGKVSCKMA